jgi:hypothetical protein
MKSYSIQTRFGITAAAFATLAILALTGCEGESRKRPSANANLPDPSAARKSDPPTPSSTTNSSVAANNSSPSETTANSSDPNTASTTQPDPVVAKPATPKVDITKLEEVRKRLDFHSAMVMPSEVNVVATGSPEDNRNMIYRPAEGLEFERLRNAMDKYKALNNNKPPKDPAAFIKFLRDDEYRIRIPELKPNAFYIYDPEAAKLDKSKVDLDYLKIYEP